MGDNATIPKTWQHATGRVCRLKSSVRPPYHATHAVVVSDSEQRFTLQPKVLQPYNLRLGDALRQRDEIAFWYEDVGHDDFQIRRLDYIDCFDTGERAYFRLPQIGQQWEGKVVGLLPNDKGGFVEVFEPDLFFHFFFGVYAFKERQRKLLAEDVEVRITVGRNNKGFCVKQATMI